MFKMIEERIAHIRALALIAVSDKEISNDELQFISHLSVKYGITPDAILNEIVGLANTSEDDIKIILATITSRYQKLLLLSDLITMGRIDGDYTAQESKKIRIIANILEVEEEKIVELELANLEIYQLQMKLNTIIELDDNKTTFLDFTILKTSK